MKPGTSFVIIVSSPPRTLRQEIAAAKEAGLRADALGQRLVGRKLPVEDQVRDKGALEATIAGHADHRHALEIEFAVAQASGETDRQLAHAAQVSGQSQETKERTRRSRTCPVGEEVVASSEPRHGTRR